MIKIALIERRAGKRKQKIKIMTEQQIEEIKRKADAGDAEAQTDFGLMHLYGIGVGKNDFEAGRWFCEASYERAGRGQNPNARACFYFGWMHYKRLTPERDGRDYDKMAWVWFYQAARAGIGEAMILIAKIGLEGKTYGHDCQYFESSYDENCELDNPPDLTKPYFWALVALSRGYREADKLIKKLETKLDVRQRMETQRRASQKGKVIPKMEKLKILEDKLFGDCERTDNYKRTDDSLLFQ